MLGFGKFEKTNQGPVTCERCHRQVFATDAPALKLVEVSGKPFHKRCLRCNSCSKDIDWRISSAYANEPLAEVFCFSCANGSTHKTMAAVGGSAASGREPQWKTSRHMAHHWDKTEVLGMRFNHGFKSDKEAAVQPNCLHDISSGW